MKSLLRAGVATVAIAATAFVGVASASAVSIQPPGTAFEGTGQALETVGSHNYVASFSTNGGSGPYVKCEASKFTGTTGASGSAEVVTTPSYTKCLTNIGGSLVTANVVTKNWTIRATSLTGTEYTGEVVLPSEAAIVTVPSISGCKITVGSQTVTGKGVNDAGSPPAGTTVNPTSATPIEVTYSSTTQCKGVESGAKSKYRGAVHIPGVYVAP